MDAMLGLDWDALRSRANEDPEFRLASRHWSATLRLDAGDASRALQIEDGVVVSADATQPGTLADLFVSAPEADWDELLAPVPRPFYQDLMGASLHHGVELPSEPERYAAYYPALRRLVQLLRDAKHGSQEGR